MERLVGTMAQQVVLLGTLNPVYKHWFEISYSICNTASYQCAWKDKRSWPKDWVSGMHVGELHKVSGSWLQPCLDLVLMAIWRVNK